MGSELPSSGQTDKPELSIEGVTTGKRDCDGVLISHYHGDHIGMFEKVLPEIPIYMGDDAHKIFMNLRKWLRDKNLKRISEFKTFTPGDKIIDTDDMTVTAYRVDHSAYDAYMYLIEAGNKRILHTGDFRSHGWTGKGLWKVAEKLIKTIDVLITEGTMLTRDSTEEYSEFDLCMDATEIMSKNRNVFVHCSSTNIDSIASFYQAAQKCKRLFVCDRYQRTNLDIVSKTAVTDLYRFPKAKIYRTGQDEKANEDCLRKMKAMGFCMLVRANGYFDEVLEMFPDSTFIYSMWEGYLKDGPAKDEKIYNFIPKADGKLKYTYRHTSGHATRDTIIKVCEKLKPGILIPIHVEDPKKFKELNIPNCKIKTSLEDGDVIVL
jgi:ribonuclease J